MSQDFDLLGDPIPEGFGKRGRPPHMVTEEKRKLVIQLQAFGWTQERIAAGMSITPPTLRKNYFRELKARAEARARVDAKLLQSLWAEAEGGNVAAVKEYFKRLDRFDLGAVTATKPPKEEKLGKKDAARRDAKAPPSSSWGTLIN